MPICMCLAQQTASCLTLQGRARQRAPRVPIQCLHILCRVVIPRQGGKHLQAFDYVAAQTVDEAVSLLAAKGAQARVLAGGTDLIVQLREGRRRLELVVDVKQIPDLNILTYSTQNGLQLGAAVPCHRIYGDAVMPQADPGLRDAFQLVGGTKIQGRASVGGNPCNSSPAADTTPTPIAHRATCVIAGPSGRREVPVEEFCTGPGRNVLG